jgi:ribosome-associated protein
MNEQSHELSRSARKRDSQALQKLGERLVKLEDQQLAKIEMPEELATAVHLARRITERGGHRRQLQYIGKLMRRIDPRPIERALTDIEASHENVSAEFHSAERWRDRLLREGTVAVDELCAEQPLAERERLLAFIQSASAESKAHHPPRAARELFRYLRDQVFRGNASHESP